MILLIFLILAGMVYIRQRYIPEEINKRDQEKLKQDVATAAVGLAAGIAYSVKHSSDKHP